MIRFRTKIFDRSRGDVVGILRAHQQELTLGGPAKAAWLLGSGGH